MTQRIENAIRNVEGATDTPAASDARLRDPTQAPEAPNCVTIFGAGIAGLTAAHELVERGYHVQVWEPAGDQRHPRRGCDVGGMARTQWSRVHWPEFRIADQEPTFDENAVLAGEPEPPPRPRHGKQSKPIRWIDQKFYVELLGEDRAPNVFAALGEGGLYTTQARYIDALKEIKAFLEKYPQVQYVYAEICYRSAQDKPASAEELAQRADRVLALIEALDTGGLFQLGKAQIVAPARGVVMDVGVDDLSAAGGIRKVRFELVVLDALPSDNVPKGTDVIVSYRVRECWLPGEHGYRFFPSFYNHLFDTMRRTPLLEPARKDAFTQSQERAVGMDSPEPYRYTATGRSAYDNLLPLKSDVLAFKSGTRPTLLSRFRIGSLEELREWIRVLFGSEAEGGFGIEARDAARLMLKVIQHLTSSGARREQYESVSWWQFVGGETLGKAAQDWIQREPRALVAMDARSADARSYGIGMAQLLLDQVRPEGYRDGSLKGPTNEAWLNPWRRYLEAQGVEFIHGKLEGFEVVEATRGGDPERRVWPQVKCYEPRYALRHGGTASSPRADLMPGYFVLALPPLEARAMATSYRKAIADAGYGTSLSPESDLGKMADWAPSRTDAEIRDPRVATRDFRHFVGIQYYFAEDVFWVEGHVYYPDSQWGLTSVSQARLWEERTDWEHGYRGILSVIIGDWEACGRCGKPAAQCSKDEIAREVWEQIQGAINKDRQKRAEGRSKPAPTDRVVGEELPQPLYWHIDDNLEDVKDVKGAFSNASPFPITAPGSWAGRPGTIERQHYEVEHAIVLAGAHLRTFTRLPTMEAANESGRRAANAILTHQPSSFRRTLCDLWNPEDREVDDLRWYKDLDERLHSRGVPHMFEVLGIDELTKELLRGGPDDPLDPVVLLTRVRRLLARLKPGAAW